MKKQPRWMKTAITSAADCQTVMPFQRAAKSMPAALKPAAAPRLAIAAR